MPPQHLFLRDLALVLCVAAATTVLFRRLKQPVVLGYLLAGVLLGRATPIPLGADPERIHALAELGVTLVMFSVGLEFSLRRLAHVFPRAGLVVAVQFSCLLVVGSLAARALGFGERESLFVGAMLGFSSTMVIARVFAEQRIGGELAELVFGVALVQDLGAVLLLALSGVLASESGGTWSASLGAGVRLASFLVALLVGGYLVVPRALRAIALQKSAETLLVSAVGLCFGLATLAQWAGYSVALGAFVAGALVAESGKQRQVQALVRPLRDLFAAIFFVAVGMMVEPHVLRAHAGAVALLALVVVLGQVASVGFGATLSGYAPALALRAALALANIGEFAFILAGALVAAGAVPPALFSIAVSVSVVTNFAAPWLIRSSEEIAHVLGARVPRPLRAVVALYGAWLARERATQGARWLRLGGRLALDLACSVGIVIATALCHARLEGWLGDAGLEPVFARALVVGAAALCVAPFLLGIARLAEALGAECAAGALPPRAPGDGAGAIPRRLFTVTLELALFALVAAPLFALTQAFVPLWWEASTFLAVFALVAWSYWRRAGRTAPEVESGVHRVLALLQRQNGEPNAAPTVQGEGLELPEELAGLGALHALRLDPASVAVGRTLAELDLRARTGASVLALTRADGASVTPTGHERLAAGDVLALSGTSEALAEARLVLTAAALPETRPRRRTRA